LLFLLSFQTGPELAVPLATDGPPKRRIGEGKKLDNTLYVGLSRQMTLRREMDVVANNIANADTKGFKVESLMLETDAERPRMAPGNGGGVPASAINFVLDDGVARDFGQGALAQTGATFDLGIEGQAFFKIGGAGGERYTRDGRFTLDSTGKLVTQKGEPVLDAGGGELVVDPTQGAVSIGRDGTMSQTTSAGTLQIGKVGLARFDDLGSLSKVGDNQYRNTSNQTVQAAPDAVIHQGSLEASNVQPVLEITRLIEVSRAYESISKTMSDAADLSKTSIQRLGRVN
jgi:flagellar basal-body rod protein FlgF